MPQMAKEGACELVRTLFMRKAATQAPNFTVDLHRYYKLFVGLQVGRPVSITLAQLQSDPKLVNLYLCLQKWAETYHVEAHWCYELAVKELFRWYFPAVPDTSYKSWETIREDYYFGDVPVSPPPGIDHFRPYTDNRPDYLAKYEEELNAELERPLLSLVNPKTKAALRDDVMGELKQYCEKVEKWFQENLGWLPVSTRKNLDRDITWAVRVHVLGDTASMIAQEEEKDVATVTRAINRILTSIDLKPRKDFKQGRKPGSKTKFPRSHLGR